MSTAAKCDGAIVVDKRYSCYIFDMFNAEFTHEGDRCSFETMIDRLAIKSSALSPIAEIVHDIDMKDSKFGRPEIGGPCAG